MQGDSVVFFILQDTYEVTLTSSVLDIFDLYLDYDYYESVRNEYGRLDFPDVTLCSNEGVSLYSMTSTLNAHNATLIFMHNSMVLHSMLVCNPRSNRHNLCDIYNIACGEEMRLMP